MSASLQEHINGIGQFPITVGDHIPSIVGVKLNAHIAKLIVHGRMMALMFGQKGHPCHEGERLLKILETELANESIVLFQPHFVVLSVVNVARRDGNCLRNPNFASMEDASFSNKGSKPIGFAPPFIDEDTIAAVSRVLRSGWITTGPETAAFENELAQFCGTERVVCGASWTGLAGVILDWFGVGPGDEVILPSYTYCATANVVLHRGATPVLVDLPEPSNQDGLNIRWADVLPHLTPRTKVIMPVDIGGWPIPASDWISELISWSKVNGFQANNGVQSQLGRPLLLLDAAHSLGATVDGATVGSQADLSVFSFHAVKNLTTAEGGAVAIALPAPFDAHQVHQSFRTLGLHGQSKDAAAKFQSEAKDAWRYDVTTPGFKCNMTDIQAAMGRVALARYSSDLTTRRRLADRYDGGFDDWAEVILPVRSDARRMSSDHLYPIRLPRFSEDERNALMRWLQSQGIATNVHFQPLPMLSAYADRGHKQEDHPAAMDAYSCEISLPIHLHMSFQDVDRVVQAVREGHAHVMAQNEDFKA